MPDEWKDPGDIFAIKQSTINASGKREVWPHLYSLANFLIHFFLGGGEVEAFSTLFWMLALIPKPTFYNLLMFRELDATQGNRIRPACQK